MEGTAPIRLILKICLGILLVIPFLYYGLKLIEPSSPPLNIFLSNIADHQTSISWVTEKPTRGEIIISEDGKFPLLPFLASKIYYDGGEKALKKAYFYTTHLVTIDNLKPETNYQFRIYQNWKKKYQGSFKTGPILSSILSPDPTYGRVVSVDKKPVVGALIYLQATNESSKSALLSTMTNSEGRWSLDLGNLRNLNLKNIFKLTGNMKEQIIVDGGSYGRVKTETSTKEDKPWPDIILK